MTNVELIKRLVELGDHVRAVQVDLSTAFGASDDDNLETLRLDEAGRALNGAFTAVEEAIEKVAALAGLEQAGIG